MCTKFNFPAGFWSGARQMSWFFFRQRMLTCWRKREKKWISYIHLNFLWNCYENSQFEKFNTIIPNFTVEVKNLPFKLNSFPWDLASTLRHPSRHSTQNFHTKAFQNVWKFPQNKYPLQPGSINLPPTIHLEIHPSPTPPFHHPLQVPSFILYTSTASSPSVISYRKKSLEKKSWVRKITSAALLTHRRDLLAQCRWGCSFWTSLKFC